MKAIFQIPDELYRELKAEAAREGRTMRDITLQLFRQWLVARKAVSSGQPRVDWRNFQSPLAARVSKDVSDHSMEAIRSSIAKRRHGAND
ncbi:MAG: hypothetical protein GVY36_08930 [Verrucomicrobia bacterium]|jgi:plasmid stability protein|nr:hypothetical protein [Verrucomicrobiota bacterium]